MYRNRKFLLVLSLALAVILLGIVAIFVLKGRPSTAPAVPSDISSETMVTVISADGNEQTVAVYSDGTPVTTEPQDPAVTTPADPTDVTTVPSSSDGTNGTSATTTLVTTETTVSADTGSGNNTGAVNEPVIIENGSDGTPEVVIPTTAPSAPGNTATPAPVPATATPVPATDPDSGIYIDENGAIWLPEV